MDSILELLKSLKIRAGQPVRQIGISYRPVRLGIDSCAPLKVYKYGLWLSIHYRPRLRISYVKKNLYDTSLVVGLGLSPPPPQKKRTTKKIKFVFTYFLPSNVLCARIQSATMDGIQRLKSFSSCFTTVLHCLLFYFLFI